jgi:hypothetical protein
MSSKSVYPMFFNPERIGETLKEVSSDLLRVESQDIVGRWFHSPDEIDLFIWVDETKTIVKQQLTFYGQVVEWNAVDGTKTGVIIEDERGHVKASETIRFDDNLQIQQLGLAMDLIQHVLALTSQEQDQLIGNFFRGQRNRSTNDAEFLKRYSHYVNLHQRSFWRRVFAGVYRFLTWLF